MSYDIVNFVHIIIQKEKVYAVKRNLLEFFLWERRGEALPTLYCKGAAKSFAAQYIFSSYRLVE